MSQEGWSLSAAHHNNQNIWDEQGREKHQDGSEIIQKHYRVHLMEPLIQHDPI